MTNDVTSSKVYVSDLMHNYSVYVKVRHTMSLAEFSVAVKAKDPIVDKIIDISRRHKSGQKLLASEIPACFFADPHHKIKTLPPAFYANGYVVVGEICADVMQKFDLGETSFNEVEFFQNNKIDRVEGRYFALNFGEQKETLLDSLSTGLGSAYQRDGVERFNFPGRLFDGSIKLSRHALAGRELWFERRLDSTLFMSRRMRDALTAAKLHVPFRFFECGLVD